MPAYVGYEEIAVSNAELDIDDLTVPAKAQGAELQAATQNVRYTMDGSTSPTTSTGALLRTTDDPKPFDWDALRNIKFIRDGGSDAVLRVHYYAGRDV